MTFTSDKESVAKVDASGEVKGISEGTAKITVTTKDGSFKATCKITVKADTGSGEGENNGAKNYKESYTKSDYYQWDAYAPYNLEDYNEDFGHGLSGYNRTTGTATQSCKDAPTNDEIQMYLGAGVYWVEDGPAYKLPDGKTYRIGLMLKKKANIEEFEEGTATKKLNVTPTTGKSYETLKNDYFFLPAAGGCDIEEARYYDEGERGTFWLSTSFSTGVFLFSFEETIVNFPIGTRNTNLPRLIAE